MKALPFPCIRPAQDRVLEALPQMGGILGSNDALRGAIADGLMLKDPGAAYYVYECSGEPGRVTGVVAICPIGVLAGGEGDASSDVADAAHAIAELKVQPRPVSLAYETSPVMDIILGAAKEGASLYAVTDPAGITHRVWEVKREDAVGAIRAMLDQFNTEYKSLDFASCEAKIKERYGVEMSDYDIVNLASIVEREGLNADQRAHVASVFYNRLAGKLDGLRYLNSDATMMYVTGGEVTADDLQSDSPYNTYKHEGLPPTPICSPSLEALKATLEPTDSDDLYFYITQDEEYFSQTYEEHQQSWN